MRLLFKLHLLKLVIIDLCLLILFIFFLIFKKFFFSSVPDRRLLYFALVIILWKRFKGQVSVVISLNQSHVLRPHCLSLGDIPSSSIKSAQHLAEAALGCSAWSQDFPTYNRFSQFFLMRCVSHRNKSAPVKFVLFLFLKGFTYFFIFIFHKSILSLLKTFSVTLGKFWFTATFLRGQNSIINISFYWDVLNLLQLGSIAF